MRCCQNKTTRSSRDSSKKSLENNVISRRGRKIHTLRDRWTCANSRVIPRHKGSPRYWIAHGWKDEFGSFNLEILKFLVHFREQGSSLYFIFISYILIFFLIFFCLYTHSFFPFSFFLFLFFYLLPLNSKIALYLPPPPCLDAARPRAKR
jgi:hypothetical protein